MKRYFFAVLLLFGFAAKAQQGYLLHLTVSSLQIGTDSLVYKKGLTKVLVIGNRSDTLEVGTVKTVPVAMIISVSKTMFQGKLKYRIGYSFFKKEFGKWVLIKTFSGSDRYDLLKADPNFEKTALKKSAREEYACSYGYPNGFSARFKLDVYRK